MEPSKYLRPVIKRDYDEIPKIEWERLPYYDKIPHIEWERSPNDGVRICILDAVVGLQDDAYYATPWALLAKECLRYTNKVLIQTPRIDCKGASAKDIMEMVKLNLVRGSLVDIIIEGGDTNNIKKEALQVYSGITTRGDRPNFERFGKK